MPIRWITAAAMLAATTAATAEATWKELARHTLGGSGGWDLLAVDAASRQVFFTRGEHLMIADVDSGKIIGDLPGLKRAHGVALAPALHRGFVSSGGDDKVIAFDLATLKPVAEIPTGKNPDAMVFDTSSRHIFAFNGKSNDVTVIDAATNAVTTTIALPGRPELAVANGHGKIFVNLEDKNQVSEIDTKANNVQATWSLGTCEEPSGLAIDTQHARLFSVCSNKQMAVLDANDGKIVASVAIGDGPDGAAFDPATGNAYSSNSDGTLTVVHEDDANRFRVVAVVVTPPRSRTITLDEKTHRVVLPIAEFGPTPAPSAENKNPRPPMKPDSFGFILVGKS